MAEILLQRTRAAQVVPVYLEVRRVLPTPRAFVEAGVRKVRQVIRPLGLAWRAKFLVRQSRALIEDHGGRVPSDPEALRTLPGVGPYSAAAYEGFHLRKRSPILDSNLVRLYGRLFGHPTGPETRRSRLFSAIAERMTPPGESRRFNYALLDFTRTVCKPTPVCKGCPLSDRCHHVRSAHRTGA